MSTARIAILPGDGIGPEIVEQAVMVLDAVACRFGHAFDLQEGYIGGSAIDAAGVPLPYATIDLCRQSNAVLLGAVGGPKWDDVPAEIRPEKGLLGIRKALGLYANIRPVAMNSTLIDSSPLRSNLIDGVDLVVIRELTGGIYFGEKTLTSHPSGEVATDRCSYDTGEIERVIRMAATIARGRRNSLVSVDKANVLETSRLWRRTATRIMADEFPDVGFEHMLVDACAMHLLRRPRDFDVIVTENMFGDILTDEASMLAGSIGMLPSASLGDSDSGRPLGLYEPIHGSAPDIAGKGIANPIGTIASVAMLLRHSLGMDGEASCVESAIAEALTAGYVTQDLDRVNGKSTMDVGRAIAARINTAPPAGPVTPGGPPTADTGAIKTI